MAGLTETPFSPPLDSQGMMYSAGIHPWEADKGSDAVWVALENFLARKDVLMVGETGLDTLKGPSLDVQASVFKRQVMLAEKVSKPVIIHAVRTGSAIMACKKTVHDIPGWILHGFRGGPEEVDQWVSKGFHLSFGAAFNPAAFVRCPPGRFFFETDDKGDIVTLYEQAASLLGWSVGHLMTVVEAAFFQLFPQVNKKGRL